jgi:hypothetical protein
MTKTIMFTSIIGLMAVSNVYACGIRGSAVNADGSKIDGSGTISTSWNSEKTYPRNGTYSLDLGDSICGKTITVYLDGNNGQEVRVDGWVTVNFSRR